MFVIIALVCVLDDTPRGHHCDPIRYDDVKYETTVQCDIAKRYMALYRLPRKNQKMVLGDCIYIGKKDEKKT